MGNAGTAFDEEREYLIETTPLWNALRECGLEYLIPERIGNMEDEHLPYMSMPKEDEDEDDDDYGYDAANGPACRDIEELMWAFNIADLTEEEFMDLMPWDLFGLTKKQFDMVDIESMGPDSIFNFCHTLKNDYWKGIMPSIEQRIRFAEAVAATGCEEMLHLHGLGRNDGFDRYIARIILSHNAEVASTLIIMYIDYLNYLREGALEINRRREAAGEKPFDYKEYPKPSHIRDLHNKAMRDARAYRIEQEALDAKLSRERKEKLKKAFRAAVNGPTYKKFSFEDRNYLIRPPKDLEEFYDEGKILNHCVGDYDYAVANNNSIILFLREKENSDEPYFTMEVVDRAEKVAPEPKFVLSQCFTVDDTIDKPDGCKDFIVRWARKNKVRIGCVL